jgi:hypothetical protein
VAKGSNRVPLNAGAYTARSLIANAQRCVNLFPEANTADSDPPIPMTHYPTPGLFDLIRPSGTNGTVRGIWRASNGALICCIGPNVYFVDLVITYGVTLMGTIPDGVTPVSFSDNGVIGVLADGTDQGYWWQIGNAPVLTDIVDAAYYATSFVAYLDGFFIWNRQGTNQFFVSPSFWNGTDPLDALDIASKIGGPDQIVAIASIHRELWIIGQLTSEVWFNSGGLDFPFERLPGVFLDHGMLRGYSLIQADVSLFWLSRDRQGQMMVFQTDGYAVKRVSTHAIELEFQSYPDVTDAIGYSYQQEGHTFVVFTFPEADKTWAYDLSTGLWHERMWLDDDGVEHRHRANCAANVYNMVVCGDHTNGRLYRFDLDVYTDNGDPIRRIRSLPHIVKDGKRISYDSFALDMQVGTPPALQDDEDPQVLLRWSDTRGASWGDTVTLPFSRTGDYLRQMGVNRLGMARDRVFEISWAFPYKTALQGPWVNTTVAET